MQPVLADEASAGEFVEAAERHAHSDGGDHEPVLQRVYKGGTMGLWLMSAHVVLHQFDVTRRPTIAARALRAGHQRSSPGVSCSLLRFDLPLRREDLVKCWLGRPIYGGR